MIEGAAVIGIGASAGGLAALRTFFAQVPDDPGVAFVVVVHLSPDHESHLHELLQPVCRWPVEQVTETVKLERNRVYVIPPGANLNSVDTHLRLSDLEQRRLERAPIDHFFRTLADTYDGRSIGVVLTGTGTDGTLGLRRIKEAGGLTVVQDPDEAEYDGMPRSALATGMVDLILPLEQIPAEVLRFAHTRAEMAMPEDGEELEADEHRLLQNLFAQVRARTGHDFGQYKRSTILRRIQRRMQLHRAQTLQDYVALLRSRRDEADALFNDLLITVTEFFRDRVVFERIERSVIPELFEGKSGPDDRIRVWSVGCSTGEEAYSIAMLLTEEAERRETRPQIQVFASDLHESMLQRAREGVYPEEISRDVTEERLRRFFSRENGHYRIRREIRELVVFASHNLLRDPPFSHMDLISCRNLLIYLQRDVQQNVMDIFHYALDPGGLLLLGTNESIESAALFVSEGKECSLYRRREGPPGERPLRVFPRSMPRTPAGGRGRKELPPQSEPRRSYGSLHERVVERYAPPSVLVNAENEVLHGSMRAGRYLRVPGGEPTNQLYQLVREPLQIELHAALHAAQESRQPVRSKPVALQLDGESRNVALHVRPASDPDIGGGECFLILFEEFDDEARVEEPRPKMGGTTESSAADLQGEVELYRQQLRRTIEQYEASREEMQASNEELQSANEELRSTMEELETSKEELQSMNEELATLNQENRQRVEELGRTTADLQNLMAATHIPTLFLDRRLRIVRFTPQARELFNIRHTDSGRPLRELSNRLEYPELQADAARVLEGLVPMEREIQDQDGRWYVTRILPYRRGEDRIEGVVVTLIDIHERVESEREVRRSKEYAEQIIETLPEPVLVLSPELIIRSANAAFYEHFGVAAEQTIGRVIYTLGNGQWDIPELRKLLENVLPSDKVFNGYEVEHEFESLGPRVMQLNGRRLDHMELILLGIRDITERRRAEKALRQAHDELEQRVGERTAELGHQTQRLRRLAGELASAEQRERRRLAAVLHDELQQCLVAAKMRLGSAHRDAEQSDVAEAIRGGGEMVEEAIEVCRNLARQLRPPVLYEDGLVPALRWLAQEMSRRHQLSVTVEAMSDGDTPSEDIAAMLYEAVRELLFNVVKHADVQAARIRVDRDESWMRICVEDEGVGLEPGTVMKKPSRDAGMGLFSVRERLAALGGAMEVEAAPGSGTRVTLLVRLPAAEPQGTERFATVAELRSVRPDVGDNRPRVLVVDDHNVVRRGIAALLQAHPQIGEVNEAADGREAIRKVEADTPDAVLMDLNLPILGGMEATREIRRRWPSVHVIGLSVQDDEATIQSFLAAGAVAFVSKSDDPHAIVEAILTASRERSRNIPTGG